MIIALLAITIIFLAWFHAKHPDHPVLDSTLVELARYLLAFLAWLAIGGLLNAIAIFLISQALYVPVYNYFSGKDVWFIDDDTWVGKQIIKYLGEGSGRVWFWIQLVAAAILIIL